MGFPEPGNADRLRRREPRRPAMAHVAEHLSVSALEQHALDDLRRRNGASPCVLTPDLLDKLSDRLLTPPPDGGLWTGSKVAAWMATELGLAHVAAQRGWEALKALGWSVQTPRPRHPRAATAEDRAAFQKNWPRLRPRKPPNTRTKRSRSGPRMSTASG